MIERKIKNKKGFTIAEVMVVVFIISFGLIGILSLISQTAQVEYVNKNMVIASQLAQEGLELVRNVRDNNFLNSPDDWKHGLGGVSSATDIIQDGLYSIDYNAGIINVESISDSGAKLYLNENSFYQHTPTDNPTIFSRIINVDSESEASTTITCLVQWQDHSNTRQYSAQTVLYDWR